MKHLISSFISKITNLFHKFVKDEIAQEPEEPKYMDVVTAEIDRLKEVIEAEATEGNELADVTGLVSESFMRMAGKAPYDRLMAKAWMKYFGFMAKKGDQIPEAMLEWMNDQNYRTVFSYVKNTVKHYMGNPGTRKTEDVNLNKIDMVIQLSDFVLDHFNKADIPALLMKGQLLRVKGDFLKAENILTQVSEMDGGFNGLVMLLDCYNEERGVLLAKLFTQGANWGLKERLAAIRRTTRELYETNEELLKKRIAEDEEKDAVKLQLVTLASKHARWERNERNYLVSRETIAGIPEDYPEYFRIVLENAFLHQCRGSKGEVNPFYDMDKAIELFQKADCLMARQMQDEKDVRRTYKSVLVPLAFSYYQTGKIEEARRTCQRVLSLDPKDKKVQELLDKLQVQNLSA